MGVAQEQEGTAEIILAMVAVMEVVAEVMVRAALLEGLAEQEEILVAEVQAEARVTQALVAKVGTAARDKSGYGPFR